MASTDAAAHGLPPRLDLAERPDDTRAQLLAAKPLVFCGFPYKRTPQTAIVREARVGAESHLTVYFSTTKLGVPIPHGADRALLAWITTFAYQSGWVSFDSLTSFFDAFHLGRSGAEYRRFSQRLERLLSLSLTFVLRTPEGEHHSNMPPLNDAFTPRDGIEARRLLTAEHSPQLTLQDYDIRRYGIVLHPKFHAYLVPRIGIPRAKGDRGGAAAGGRWIFLGPESVRLLRAIARPPGSEHLTVPGDRPGQPLYRLNEAWWCVLELAGLPRMTVKALRHSWSTHSVGVIAPEHRAQLLGHRGAKMTDTVYLHRHGPDLARAAALVEEHLRGLLGDLPRSGARLLHFAAPSGAWGAS